jgi:hypothetical protein
VGVSSDWNVWNVEGDAARPESGHAESGQIGM